MMTDTSTIDPTVTLSNLPCSWCKLTFGDFNTAHVPHINVALCPRCLTEMLEVFDRKTRHNAAESLQTTKYTGNYCDDPECASCFPPSGCGGDGHIW